MLGIAKKKKEDEENKNFCWGNEYLRIHFYGYFFLFGNERIYLIFLFFLGASNFLAE